MQEFITVILFFFVIFLILSFLFKYLWPLFLILLVVMIFNSWRAQKRREALFKDLFDDNKTTNQAPPNFNKGDVIDADYKEHDLD
jgi:uncharacterized membrane protein